MEEETQVAGGIQRESTAEDYWNTLNPAAITFNNPELKFNAASDSRGDLEFDSEEFQTYFKTANGSTKKAMLQANNKVDAIKIAQRNDIFIDSQKAIEQDGMLTQFGMGILPAVASPTSLIPFGGVFKKPERTTSINKRNKRLGSILNNNPLLPSNRYYRETNI